MVLKVPRVGPSAFGIVFVSYGFRMILSCFRMVVIVPLVSSSDLGVVFVWFCKVFILFLIVPLVGSSALGVVFVCFSYAFVRFSYGFNRPTRWFIGLRDRFRLVFLMVL